MHAMGDVIDMRRFRGLRHRLPITCWTFAVGGTGAVGDLPARRASSARTRSSLALKSAVARGARAGLGMGLHASIYWVAVFTAFLTAFYTGRAFFMTFLGPEKLPSPDDPEVGRASAGRRPRLTARSRRTTTHGARPRPRHDVGHESPPVMTYPADRAGRLHGPDRPDLPARLAVLGGRPSGSATTWRTRSASSRSGTPSTASTG